MTDSKNRNRTGQDDDFLLFPDMDGSASENDRWLGTQEGRLAVDVHETGNEIVVKSAIAGVRPEDLEIFVHNGMLTIRGSRHDDDEVKEGQTVVRECHWGSFSRSLILPVEVDADDISAVLRNGVLTIKMTKVEKAKKIAVKGK